MGGRPAGEGDDGTSRREGGGQAENRHGLPLALELEKRWSGGRRLLVVGEVFGRVYHTHTNTRNSQTQHICLLTWAGHGYSLLFGLDPLAIVVLWAQRHRVPARPMRQFRNLPALGPGVPRRSCQDLAPRMAFLLNTTLEHSKKSLELKSTNSKLATIKDG